MSSDIEQHLRTLIAMRVNYIFKDPSRKSYQVRDLRRRPVELDAVPPIDPQQVVSWELDNILLVRALAQRLGVRFMPTAGIITLPADVEEKLASVEREAMQRTGRPEGTVRLTIFDVRLVNGAYEPYVIGFQ